MKGIGTWIWDKQRYPTRHYGRRHIAMDFVYVVIIDTLIALFLSATGIRTPLP